MSEKCYNCRHLKVSPADEKYNKYEYCGFGSKKEYIPYDDIMGYCCSNYEFNEVLEFIQRRFPTDCNWISGNCYFFALILKSRFPKGDIYYDVIDGHFVFKYEGKFYDWTGFVNPKNPIEWGGFEYYDISQRARIIKDCIL